MDSSHECPSQWLPAFARHQIRTNPSMQQFGDSGGFCLGYMQTNVIIVPSGIAEDLCEFCRLNEAPCPLLYRSKPGEVSAGYLAKTSDIRTDLSRYNVYKKSPDGSQQHSTPNELKDYPWDDMVTFYTGCSFSFAGELAKEGVYTQSIDRAVSIFQSNIECLPIGRITCPGMAVTMRPIRKDLVQKAVEITARFDEVHGAPIHIGDPAMIGIRDILRPEWGDPADFSDNRLVPVFWGCGHTLVEVVRHSNLDIAFGHSVPGTLFLTDVKTEDFFRDKLPRHGNEQPIVVTLQDEPYFASILGHKTHTKISKIEELIIENDSDQATKSKKSKGLVKSALRVSHAKTVAISTRFAPSNEIDRLLSMLVMAKILQAVGKVVTIVTSDVNATTIVEDIVADLIKAGILQKEIDIQGLSTSKINEGLNISGLLHSLKKFDVVVEFGKLQPKQSSCSETILPVETKPVTMASMANDVQNGATNLSNGNGCDSAYKKLCVCVSDGQSGLALSMSVLILQNCLIHSRYRRHGIGEHRDVTLEVVMDTVKQFDSMWEFMKSRDIQDKEAKNTLKHHIEQMVHIHSQSKQETEVSSQL